MVSSVMVGAIGVAAASVFGAIARQFRAYQSGKPSYLSALQGNAWLTGVFILLVNVGSSALLTFLLDGSLAVFWSIFAGFAVFIAAVFGWLYSLKRRGR